MIKNYLLIAFRQFLKERTFSFITVFGLALGLTCVLCILLFVYDELSYDQYHSKANRMYRVIQGGDSEEQSSSLPFPTGPTLMNDYPSLIEQYVRLFNFQASSLSIVYENEGGPQSFNEPAFFFADSSYFRIFDHTFIKGNPEKALNGPNFVVVTESTAKRYFGTTEAIGTIIRFEGKYDLVVTGVIEDVPANSHFKFNFLASFGSLSSVGFTIPEKNWYWNPVWTYVLLRENTPKFELQNQLRNFVQKYYHPSLREETELNLQSVPSIYLHSKAEYEIGAMSDVRYVKIFSIIGSVILIIAIINFVNLTTARATDRFKEIGVRKVTGASRRRILFQLLIESIIISVISLVVAGVLTLIAIPFLNQLAGKTFSVGEVFEGNLVMTIVAIAMLAGLASGIYPAIYLSALNPSHALKNSQGGPASRTTFRKALTVFQFAVSVILIVGSFVIFQQIKYMKSASLGFDKEEIIALPVQRLSLVPKYESFKDQLLQNSAITSVSTSNTLVGSDYQSSNYKKEGEEESSFYPCFFVRNDFLKTMGIKKLAGRDFIEEVTTPGYHAIINHSLCKQWGWTPEEAVGKKIEGTLEGEIIIEGVAEDFHYASLKQTIGPMILLQSDHTKHKDFFTRYVLIRINTNQVQEAISFIAKTWNQNVTESPFDYFFLDEKLNAVYKQEEKVNKISTVFCFFAVFIGCLGLYGLAIFSFRKRKKEVAVRKVLGASEKSIARLFTFDFMKLVLMGFVAGAPLAYYFSHIWLEGFSYRILISPWIFLFSLILLMAIALLTIIFQTVKASLTNPATVLRNE